MKQRTPQAAVLLSIFIPFYYLYWLSSAGKDMRALGVNAPKLIHLLLPFVLFPFVILLALISRVEGGTGIIINITILLFGIWSVVNLFVYDYRFAKAVSKLPNSKNSTMGLFLLQLFVSIIVVYIAQDMINSAGSNQNTAQLRPSGPVPNAPPQAVPSTPPQQQTLNPWGTPAQNPEQAPANNYGQSYNSDN